jgi:hypothetical protein
MGTSANRLPLKRLHRHLSRAYFGVAEVSLGTPVPSVGEPDLEGGFFSDKQILQKLPQWPHDTNMSLVLTELPIEGNFFARSVRNVSIITTFEARQSLVDSEFSLWDYLMLKCIQETFWLGCKLHSGAGELQLSRAMAVSFTTIGQGVCLIFPTTSSKSKSRNYAGQP